MYNSPDFSSQGLLIGRSRQTCFVSRLRAEGGPYCGTQKVHELVILNTQPKQIIHPLNINCHRPFLEVFTALGTLQLGWPVRLVVPASLSLKF